MPPGNAFRHQEYTSDPPRVAVEQIEPEPGPALDTDEGRARLRAAGDRMRTAGVEHVLLVHGTFVGADALGLLRGVSRFAPGLAERLRDWEKRTVDGLLGDAANYTADYARVLEDGLGIEVRLFRWSSENHHLGRSEAAVRLVDELPSGRVLVWAHSHGGNVLALATNLLGADAATRRRFFRAGRAFRGAWRGARRKLAEESRPTLDVVTFGTPIRYGWESRGYESLLHFVNHRPLPGLAETRAPFPPAGHDLRHGTGGDLVQPVGVAGTNGPPSILAWRSWRTEMRLHRLLQRGIRSRDLLKRLALGSRVPDEGTALLVDYGDGDGSIAGHAVYTRPRWILFHAEQVARRFYPA